MKAWLLGIGDALSQLANKVLFNGNPNESLSGRAWRTGSVWRRVIDAILFWDEAHCEVSYLNDIRYARELLRAHEARKC